MNEGLIPEEAIQNYEVFCEDCNDAKKFTFPASAEKQYLEFRDNHHGHNIVIAITFQKREVITHADLQQYIKRQKEVAMQ